MTEKAETPKYCDDCKGPIFNGDGPLDGWQLEDGRNVCHDCCVEDMRRKVQQLSANPITPSIH